MCRMNEGQQAAIVTGAGSGIGRDTAVLLAEAGYHVVLVGRTESSLQETARLIADECGADAVRHVHPADLTDQEACRQVVDATAERFGRLDALCNIAGYAPLGPISKIDAETWRRCIDTNLTSVVMLTNAAWPIFEKQRNGVVVNVSSMASIDPFPGFSMYAAAKIGVNMFTQCTADEGKKIGVRAVAIAPGAVETPLLRTIFPEAMIPKHKTLDPVELATIIRDCVTGLRAFSPGETIVVPSP